MKITIVGRIVKQGSDAEYQSDGEIELEIDHEAKMIMTIDGEIVFKVDCLELKNAIDAFNI